DPGSTELRPAGGRRAAGRIRPPTPSRRCRRTPARGVLRSCSSLPPRPLARTYPTRRSRNDLPAADPAREQAVRLRLGRLAGARPEEVEVAALVGLQHVLEVERAVAAAVARLGRAELGEAPRHL